MTTADAKKLPVQVAWRPLDTKASRLISFVRRWMHMKPGSLSHWRVEVGEAYAVELGSTKYSKTSSQRHIKSLKATISRRGGQENVDGQIRWTREPVGFTDLDETQVMEEAQKVIEHMEAGKESKKYHLTDNNCQVFATHLVDLIVIGGKPANMPISKWSRDIRSRIPRRSRQQPKQNTPTTAIGKPGTEGHDHSAASKNKVRSRKSQHPIPRKATVYTNKWGERVAKQRPWP